MMSILCKTLLALSLLSTIGCANAYYKPTTMTIPNFKEKNEVFLAVNANIAGGDLKGIQNGDVQAAYAITDHLAVQANYMTSSDVVHVWGFLSPSYDITRKMAFGECAIGYFTESYNFLTFSVFGGYGTGNVSNKTDKEEAKTADFSKLFLQSSFGFREKNAESIVSVKLATLDYKNVKQPNPSTSGFDNPNPFANPIPLAEFSSVTRVGYEKIKFQFHVTTSFVLGSRPSFEYDWLSLGAGICTQLNTKKKVKK